MAKKNPIFYGVLNKNTLVDQGQSLDHDTLNCQMNSSLSAVCTMVTVVISSKLYSFTLLKPY